jgi:acetyl-CoA carboxylase biotin carboxyl carrier protein
MTEFDLDEDLVKRLSSLLHETDLTEIEYESGGHRIRVARTIQQATTVQAPAPAQTAATSGAGQSAPPQPHPEASSDRVPPGAVTAPMVGTVYVAPEPGAAPYVQVGSQVGEGETLLIVEAMKVMNPLPAPRGGTVTRIMVSDGQPVEFGEPLLVIE